MAGVEHPAEPQGYVKTLGDQISVGRRGRQLDIQVRVQGAEQFQRRHHFGQRIFHRSGDAQRALEFGVLAARFVNRQASRFQHAQAMHVKTLPRFSQRQPPGVTREQGHAQLSLEALDIEADHGTGLPQ